MFLTIALLNGATFPLHSLPVHVCTWELPLNHTHTNKTKSNAIFTSCKIFAAKSPTLQSVFKKCSGRKLWSSWDISNNDSRRVRWQRLKLIHVKLIGFYPRTNAPPAFFFLKDAAIFHLCCYGIVFFIPFCGAVTLDCLVTLRYILASLFILEIQTYGQNGISARLHLSFGSRLIKLHLVYLDKFFVLWKALLR